MVEQGDDGVLHAEETPAGSRVEACVDVVGGVVVVVVGVGEVVVGYYGILCITIRTNVLILIGVRARCVAFLAAQHAILAGDGGTQIDIEDCSSRVESVLGDLHAVVERVGPTMEDGVEQDVLVRSQRSVLVVKIKAGLEAKAIDHERNGIDKLIHFHCFKKH